MKHIIERKFKERGFSMGNMLAVLAIAGAFYVAKEQHSGPNIKGEHSSQVVKVLGQPVAKESIPRPS